MSREPAQPVTSVRPAWVGLCPHLAPDAGQAWLRPNDPAHARMVRHLGARALHEPLLALLEGPHPAPDLDLEGVVPGASMALRSLLPGQPKPVAALTLSPEVTLPLLQALGLSGRSRDEARVVLAAQVLFSLALASALTHQVTLTGPLLLQHSATRRGLRLLQGQRLLLHGNTILLDDEALDPWGPTLGRLLSEQHGFALERDTAWDTGLLGDALAAIAGRDPHAESVAALFVALEVVSAGVSPSPQAPHELPLAIGRARLPRDGGALVLARGLLRESVFHKLSVLRLTDPLVCEEATLPALLQAADAWVARRLQLGTEPSGREARPPFDPNALTPLGQQVWMELS